VIETDHRERGSRRNTSLHTDVFPDPDGPLITTNNPRDEPAISQQSLPPPGAPPHAIK